MFRKMLSFLHLLFFMTYIMFHYLGLDDSKAPQNHQQKCSRQRETTHSQRNDLSCCINTPNPVKMVVLNLLLYRNDDGAYPKRKEHGHDGRKTPPYDRVVLGESITYSFRG